MASLLTFTYLRELQKKERDSRKLEKLPANFYAALAEYVARKESNIDSTLMEKKEFESAVPVIKYILDRREQKILEIAMMSIRADGVKPENFLPEEEALFNEVRGVLKKHEDALGKIFVRQKPEEKEKKENGTPISDTVSAPVQVQKAEEAVVVEEKKHEAPVPAPVQVQAQAVSDKPDEQKTASKTEGVLTSGKSEASLKILKDVPSFIAEDMLAHGPWSVGETAACPPKAAKILVKNGFAEYG